MTIVALVLIGIVALFGFAIAIGTALKADRLEADLVALETRMLERRVRRTAFDDAAFVTHYSRRKTP